jgi:hypothetical protein
MCALDAQSAVVKTPVSGLQRFSQLIGDLDVAQPYDACAAPDEGFVLNGDSNVGRQRDRGLGVLSQGRGSKTTASRCAYSANPLIFVGEFT